MVEFLVTQTASAPASTAETIRSVLIRDSLALHWTPWVRLTGLLLAERRPAEGCLARPDKGCTTRKESLLVCSELAVVSLCHNTMLRAIFACFAPAIRHSKTQKARNSKRGFACFQATCGTDVRSVASLHEVLKTLTSKRRAKVSMFFDNFWPLPHQVTKQDAEHTGVCCFDQIEFQQWWQASKLNCKCSRAIYKSVFSTVRC